MQQLTEFTYDGGDLVQIKDPLNRILSLFTDGAGRLLTLTDPQGNRTRYEYDSLNQITKVIENSGAVTELTYDANGNALSVKDARNQTTSFTYDNMDRVLTRTDALQGASSAESYEYDVAGNVTKLIDRRGKVTSLSYDSLNRPTFAGYGTVAGPTYESTVDYTYDAYDRVTQVVDSSSGTITISFDDVARTASETTAQGTVGYSYDAAGRLITKTVTDQSAISYSYDNADRLLSISQGTSNVSFSYDNASRRSTMTLPNEIVVEYGYDAASQLISLTYKNGSTVIGDLTYQYDQSGRRTRVGGSYARTGLPPALSGTTYNAVNRLTQRGAATLTYDANGNLTNDGVNSYTWNARNELVGISGSVSASFQYDAFGRRTRKTIGGVATDYLYDGINVVQEKIGGTPSANLLTGGIDEVFSRTESTTQSFIADGLGSTVALLDSAGVAQTDYTYEPFGNTTVAGVSNGNSSQYTGRENDGTGLYYYRARYYSPALQRFISEDQIDLAGGDTNLYAYVSNSPCNFTDPSGNGPLATACLVGAAIAVGTDVLTGRKPTLRSAVEGCLGGLFGFGLGRALGPLLRGLMPRLPRVPRVPRVPRNGGTGAPVCFVAGTLVKTADGYKKIEEIKAGDSVIAFDPERLDSASPKPQAQLVTQTFERNASIVLDIRIDDTTITATPEHPFWVVGAGWTAAGELRRGSALLTKDGVVVHVDTIERREGKFKVYNFEVAGSHTYYVSAVGVLVHNQCGGRKWPNTPDEMDDLLSMRGRRVPDGPTTPGRDKVVWEPSDNVKITYEQHPYHPNAPPFHRNPHYHLDTPGRSHVRYFPGDPIP